MPLVITYLNKAISFKTVVSEDMDLNIRKWKRSYRSNRKLNRKEKLVPYSHPVSFLNIPYIFNINQCIKIMSMSEFNFPSLSLTFPQKK